jgi:hypothetical protein
MDPELDELLPVVEPPAAPLVPLIPAPEPLDPADVPVELAAPPAPLPLPPAPPPPPPWANASVAVVAKVMLRARVVNLMRGPFN